VASSNIYQPKKSAKKIARKTTNTTIFENLEHGERFRRVVPGCLVVEDVGEPLDVASVGLAAGLDLVKHVLG
jgi:hypothetical protein